MILGCIQSLGLVLVGIAPGSFAEDITNDRLQMALHSLGALLAILGVAVHALVQGAWSWRDDRRFAAASVLLGAMTPLLLLAASLSGRPDLGLGRGTFERFGVYAALVWLGLVGAIGLIRASGLRAPRQGPTTARAALHPR